MHLARRFALLAALVPAPVWSQAPGKPMAIDIAYVEIVPADLSEADHILAVERGVELVLCQAGIRRRVEGRDATSELKLVASLAKAELEADGGRCEIINASATLPGGASIALPDMALARPMRGRGGAESLFLACGASFTRTALDALKDRISVRGSGCKRSRK
jgi:hypothetical protein